MPATAKPFTLERRRADSPYLHVHVRNKATVIIKDEDEGVVVDVYPFKNLDGEPSATTWAHLHDLEPGEQPPKPPAISAWQRAALASYDLGEFRYIADATTAATLREGLRDCGDSLLRFIVSELSPQEDCESFDDAIRRMTVARNQLNDLIEDLQEAANNPAAALPFTARWLIELDASSPQDAARKALAIHRDPASIATHFTVRDNTTGETTDIDLLHPGEGG